MRCHRLVSFGLGSAALLVAAVAICWPGDPDVRAQDTAPEPPSKTAKLVAAESAFFVTFRPSDFTSDDLVKTVFHGLGRELDQTLRVPLTEIDRVTFALVRGGMRQGPITIVTTRKAFDADKLKAAFVQDRFGGFKEKDGGPRMQPIGEKKVAGKTIYSAQHGRSWCAFDKTTYLFGDAAPIANFLEGKGKASDQMGKAMDLSTKHSLVFALDGKRMRAILKEEMPGRRGGGGRRFEDDIPPPREDRRKDDSAAKTRKGRLVPVALQQEKAREDDKPKKGDEDGLDDLFADPFGGITMLPIKPLLVSDFGLVTLDVKKTYTLAARVDSKDADKLDDAEVALKYALYMLRELARILPRMEREFEGMQPLAEPIQKAFKSAKVERKGDRISTVVTLTPDPALGKKVREKVEENRKREEKERNERFKDKDKRFEGKDGEKKF